MSYSTQWFISPYAKERRNCAITIETVPEYFIELYEVRFHLDKVLLKNSLNLIHCKRKKSLLLFFTLSKKRVSNLLYYNSYNYLHKSKDILKMIFLSGLKNIGTLQLLVIHIPNPTIWLFYGNHSFKYRSSLMTQFGWSIWDIFHLSPL